MKFTRLLITPIVVLIIGKILGILFTAVVFSLDVQLDDIFSLFKTMFSSGEDEKLILLSSYSDLVMFTVLSTGLVVSLSSQVGQTKRSLTKNELDVYFKGGFGNLLRTASKLYGKSLYWMGFIALANLYLLFNTLTGKTYLWIYVTTLILTISLLLYFYYDFHKEIQLSKNKLFKNEL